MRRADKFATSMSRFSRNPGSFNLPQLSGSVQAFSPLDGYDKTEIEINSAYKQRTDSS